MDTVNHGLFMDNPLGDGGGPWYHVKETRDTEGGFATWSSGRGVCKPTWIPTVSGDQPITLTSSQLNSAGTTAIARTEPTDPSFAMSTFVGELREGLPGVVGSRLWKEQAAVARGAGSEYLNYEFGWKPLVSDVKKFANAVSNSHDIISGYRAGSGKKIRRRMVFPPGGSSRSFSGQVGSLPSSAGSFTGSGTISLENKTWFSGCFTYHVPMSDPQTADLKRYYSYARKLLGVEITPEVLWNLAPWSWAADWFGTAGDVFHNISALGRDGLVLRYGYVMAQSKLVTSFAGRNTGVNPKVSGTSTYTKIVQQRQPATPYGFGVDLKSLSASQTAVLVALGLSRS
jgi:hypothetical protein